MQKFLLANLILIVGFSLSLVYSFILVGKTNTYKSISTLSGRTISLFLPVDHYIQKDGFKEYPFDFANQDSSHFYIKGVSDYNEDLTSFPLLVPTNGIAGHKNFLYLPDSHPGIDIWSNIDGKPLEGKKHGYPVYSACGGTVFHYKPANEEIEIKCDPIPDYFKGKVPSLNVKILYSHLGDGETLEAFHSLKVGQRIERGEFIGYQGNKSSFAPENRVVHLHFGVYDLATKQSPPPSLDPTPYIGVNTHEVGQLFKVNYE